MAGIGFIITLFAASGVDVPDPTANYIALAVGLVLMAVGTYRERR